MKKKIAAMAATGAILLSVATAFAARPEEFPAAPGDTPKGPADYWGLNNPGMASHLYLYEKDSDWNLVPDGALGKMTYTEGKIVFNGKGLEPETDYSLIEYPEPQITWPHPIFVVGSEMTKKNGTLHISADYVVGPGGKYWLAPTSDLMGSSLSGWNPTEYLFEYNLIP